MSFSFNHEKSVQKASAVLPMIRRTFSPITRMDFQIPFEAYVRPLLEYASQVVYSGRKKGVILIEGVQIAATKMVAGLKSVDYETRLVVLDPLSLKYRHLRGNLVLIYAVSKQGLANSSFTVDAANTAGTCLGNKPYLEGPFPSWSVVSDGDALDAVIPCPGNEE
ncbi:hypothetical protein CLF_106793 [Clonorchis sinensis]|uniref:Uncharacterized protein n=1 Tax=Clonorchis sinensis TaxID=79923 RepID=H2KRN9_CLOSI|nr:hypothetical protein CLF_106793 [Clonorchis sinensis]